MAVIPDIFVTMSMFWFHYFPSGAFVAFVGIHEEDASDMGGQKYADTVGGVLQYLGVRVPRADC